MILFTADWHIKLGQKNVPVPWACSRYQLFFQQVQDAITNHDVSLHIIGGDLFDRVPSMDELTLYFDFVRQQKVRTIIFLKLIHDYMDLKCLKIEKSLNTFQ